MAKTITFNNGTEDVTLNVLSVSSSVYNGVKNALKIVIDGAEHSFDEIHGILENTGEITEKEDGVVTFIHSGFELLPDSNFLGQYKDGKWDITLVQRNTTQSAVVDTQDALLEAMLMISDLEVRVEALEGQNEPTEEITEEPVNETEADGEPVSEEGAE